MRPDLKAVVLAAGKGTRLQVGDGDVPKAMREVCGKPLLWYVLDSLSFIEKENVIIVVGYKKDEIINRFKDYTFADQTEQLGTGHAVMSASAELSGFSGAVLVCYGDMPAIRRATYEALVKAHYTYNYDCTILTGESSIPLPYGRIVRGANGDFMHVVEDRDCTREQLAIKELNSGVYVFRTPPLLDALKSITRDNSQGEYYLTDVPKIMKDGGGAVGTLNLNLGDEIIGVNTQEQLEQVEGIMRIRNSEFGIRN